MPDGPMLINSLLAKFADDVPEESIGPQEMRSLIRTLLGGWGRIAQVGAPVSLTVASNDVWVPVDVTTQLGEAPREFDMPENNRLRGLSVTPTILHAQSIVNIAASNGNIFDFAVFKNEDLQEDSIVRLEFGPDGLTLAATMFTDFVQREGDEMSIRTMRVDGSDNPTVHRTTLSVRTHFLDEDPDA